MLLLLFLGSGFGGSSLGGLRLRHALLELVHAAGGVDELLLSGIERMADVADTDDDYGLGGTGFNHVSTGATDFRVRIFRMNVSFHKRPENLAAFGRMTRGILVVFFGFQWF